MNLTIHNQISVDREEHDGHSELSEKPVKNIISRKEIRMLLRSVCTLLWGAIASLLTLPPLSSPVHKYPIPPPKVILIGAREYEKNLLLSAISTYTPDRTTIRNIEIDYRKPVSMREMYARSVMRPETIPLFHQFSTYHFQYIYSTRFGRSMTYSEYCLFEESVADVVVACAHDRRPDIVYTFLFSDPVWLDSESILSYTTSEEHDKIQRVVVQDLDGEALFNIEPSIERRIFTWRIQNHPRV